MNNQELVDLNFRRLIDYRGQPPVRREHPIECFGYCTSCEDKKIIDRCILGRMSHGCDTADYIEALGGPFSGVERFDKPVVFLLEDPGGDQDLGDPFPYQGHCKAPPVKCYYFAPEREALQDWPSKIDDFDFRKYYYGPYFAYLMSKHGLRHVYITNIVKCGVGEHQQLKKEPVYKAITCNCVKRFLFQELGLVRPSVVFCFSHAVESRFYESLGSPSFWNVRYLTHPAFIRRRWKTYQAWIERNDQTIRQALGELKSS